MIKLKYIVLFILFVSINSQAMDPFIAKYTVFKDGKEIGDSSIELTKEESFYRLTDKTKGTHGMASFLGFKRSEVTLFAEKEGKLDIDSYQMKQKVAFNKRLSSFQVDKQTQMVYGKHKGDEWQVDLPALFYTPNLVSLKLFDDICAGKKEKLEYPVLKAGKLQVYKFVITSEKGTLIEIDKLHSKPSRITKTWLDTNQHCIPVRTYHKEEGEDALESKLKEYIRRDLKPSKINILASKETSSP